MATVLAKRSGGIIVALADQSGRIIHWLIKINNVFADIRGVYLDEITLLDEWHKLAHDSWFVDEKFHVIDVDQITLGDTYMSEYVTCIDGPSEDIIDRIMKGL